LNRRGKPSKLKEKKLERKKNTDVRVKDNDVNEGGDVVVFW
jgi:hypothetical protein